MRFCSTHATAGLWAIAAAASASAQITLSEIRTGPGRVPTGTTSPSNAEYIELQGPPGASLAGLAIVVIGDGNASTTKSGVVEWLYRFASTDVIGSNGFFVLRNPGANAAASPADTSGPFPLTVAAGATDLPWPYQTATGTAGATQIENGDNQTFLLVNGYTGTDTFQTRSSTNGEAGQDLDANDDGQLDATPWTAVLDRVVFKQTNGNAPIGTQVWWYGTPTVGPEATRVVSTTGTPIASWTMPTAIPASTSGTTYEYGPADGGANAATASIRGVHATAATAWSSPAGNGSAYSFSANNWLVNDYFEFTTSTIGFAGVSLQFDQTRSSSGPATFRVDMSTDGTSFTTILASYTVAENGAAPNLSWSSSTYRTGYTHMIENIAGAAGKPSVKFRLVCIGAPTGTGGTSRIDNVLVRFGNTPTTVSNYSAPSHAYRTPSGTWVSGLAPVTDAAARLDTPGAPNPPVPLFACGAADAGDCSTARWNPSCSDQCCCQQVCAADAFCCQVQWDSICAAAAVNCDGNCGNACPADINDDGVVDGNDLGTLLAAWGPGTGSADLNNDGVVDGNDLGSLLAAWGPCSGG